MTDLTIILSISGPYPIIVVAVFQFWIDSYPLASIGFADTRARIISTPTLLMPLPFVEVSCPLWKPIEH